MLLYIYMVILLCRVNTNNKISSNSRIQCLLRAVTISNASRKCLRIMNAYDRKKLENLNSKTLKNGKFISVIYKS